MKIKELHPDMDRYLRIDCYCPNEVYSTDGFFYQIVKQDDEAKLLGTYPIGIMALWQNQILIIAVKDNQVIDVTRVDATENNLTEVKKAFENNGELEIKIDEFPDNKTAEDLQKIMSIADAVMVIKR
jgi:hypothetical protein